MKQIIRTTKNLNDNEESGYGIDEPAADVSRSLGPGQATSAGREPCHAPHGRERQVPAASCAGTRGERQRECDSEQPDGAEAQRAPGRRQGGLLRATGARTFWKERAARHHLPRRPPHHGRHKGLCMLAGDEAERHLRHREPRALPPRLSPHARLRLDERSQRHVLQRRCMASLLPMEPLRFAVGEHDVGPLHLARPYPLGNAAHGHRARRPGSHLQRLGSGGQA